MQGEPQVYTLLYTLYWESIQPKECKQQVIKGNATLIHFSSEQVAVTLIEDAYLGKILKKSGHIENAYIHTSYSRLFVCRLWNIEPFMIT